MTLLDIELGLRDAPEFFRTDEDTYATGLMFLAERFQLLLENADDVGMIVVDSRFREDDARLRRFFADLTKDGSPYSRLDRIVEGLFLGPSHYSIGLQCADLVFAITAAAERGNGQARGYLKSLLPRFATHPATGALDGVGIKRFPETVRRLREDSTLPCVLGRGRSKHVANAWAVRRRKKPRAGRAALAEFRRRRRTTIRREWRDWTILVGLIVVFVARGHPLRWVATGGLGGRARDAPHGADRRLADRRRRHVPHVGARRGGRAADEEVLLELPDGWRVFHDVPDGWGNWDHIAIGPAGVFAIDTKSYSSPAVVENDTLRSGRFARRGRHSVVLRFA